MVVTNTPTSIRRGAELRAARLEITGVSPSVNFYDSTERQKILAAASRLVLDADSGITFDCFVGTVMLSGTPADEALELRWKPSANTSFAWPWIDLQAWEIVFPATLSGRRRNRYVPIVPPLGRLLSTWPAPKKGRLFPFTISNAQIEELWDETLRLARVRRISIRELRHTFTVMMREAGLSASETFALLA